MKIFIGKDLLATSDGNFKAMSVNYVPFDTVNGMHMTEEEMLQNGYLTDFDVPQLVVGQMYEVYFNPTTNIATANIITLAPAAPTTEERLKAIEDLLLTLM